MPAKPATPTIYRRRYIPDEKVCLRDDTIIFHKDNILLTKWATLRPRRDFDSGLSCYFMDKGVKVSKFFLHGDLCYHYIDIIETQIDPASGEIVFNDLLIDIIIEINGFVKVVDLDQIPAALESGLITVEQSMYALKSCAWVLGVIYKGDFDELLGRFDHNSGRC